MDSLSGGFVRGLLEFALGPAHTLEWAFGQINAQNRIVTCAPSLVGDIKVSQVIKWNKPLTTLDLGPCDVNIRPPCTGAGCEAILVGATHNVVMVGVRGEGTFNELNPQVPINRSSVLTIEGDMVPVAYPWDTEPLAGGARRILIDRSSVTRVQDDGLAVWCGAEDVSILRSVISRSWHPSTAGCDGVKPAGDPKERRRVTWAYNVWYRNGARQIRALEGLRDWRFVRNIIADIVPYVSPNGLIDPNAGLWLEDNAALENDNGYIVGNLGLPNGLAKGCIVGSKPGCDSGAKCGNPPTLCPSNNYAACNPKMVNTHWFFDRNDWGGSMECVTNPPGWRPVARRQGLPSVPVLDEERPWVQVLSEAGPPKRRPSEQSDLDWIAQRLPQ